MIRELAMFVLGATAVLTILVLGWASKLYLKRKQLAWVKLQNNNDRARVLTQAVAEAASRMKLSPADTSLILGFSHSEASGLLKGTFFIPENSKAWELSSYFVRLYSSLVRIIGEDNLLIENWVKSPNSAFNQQIPLDYDVGT